MAKDTRVTPKAAKAPDKREKPRSGKDMAYDSKAATGKRKTWTGC